MFSWLLSNAGTIAVFVIVAAIITLVIVSMRRNKKKGKSSCGCGSGCAGCPMGGECSQNGESQ